VQANLVTRVPEHKSNNTEEPQQNKKDIINGILDNRYQVDGNAIYQKELEDLLSELYLSYAPDMNASLDKSMLQSYCDELATELGFEWTDVVTNEIKELINHPKAKFSY
jgi:hypothetical protein